MLALHTTASHRQIPAAWWPWYRACGWTIRYACPRSLRTAGPSYFVEWRRP